MIAQTEWLDNGEICIEVSRVESIVVCEKAIDWVTS